MYEEVKKVNDKKLLFLTNFLIAKIWYKTRSYNKAIDYFKRSRNSFYINDSLKNDLEKDFFLKENFLLVDNDFRIGTSYHRLLEKNDSIIMYKDSALYYYNKVLDRKIIKIIIY